MVEKEKNICLEEKQNGFIGEKMGSKGVNAQIVRLHMAA